MLLLMTLSALLASDTLRATTLPNAPTLDGRVAPNEYGAPALRIATSSGDVPVWIARRDGFVYIATMIADSSFYWGDDFVVSVDPMGGSRTGVPAGARQWYLRRTLDSSIVTIAPENGNGRWYTTEPSALGARREDRDWNVASTSTVSGWSVELRIRESAFRAGADSPRVAFRTYNDAPRGWWSSPAPPPGTPAQRVERSAELWSHVVLR